MPVGSGLNGGLGRTHGDTCEHAAAVGFEKSMGRPQELKGERKDLGAARPRRKAGG